MGRILASPVEMASHPYNTTLQPVITRIFILHKTCFNDCNFVGGRCAAGDLSMNSKCYRKLDRPLKWYSASNDCLSRGGSLAVFTDIGRPLDNKNLTDWLNTTGVLKTYWIGLIRSWWKVTNEGNRPIWHYWVGVFCVLSNQMMCFCKLRANMSFCGKSRFICFLP